MSEEKEKTAEEVTYDLIEGYIANEQTEDVIFTSIAEHTGKGIIDAVRVYKKFLKDTGRVMTPAQRKEKITEIIKEHVEDGKVADFNTLVEDVAKQLSVAESTASANVKAACKAMDIPTPEKSTALGEVNSWLVAHPDAERKAFNVWMESTGRTAATASSYWSAFLFARRCFTEWTKAFAEAADVA